MGGNTAGKRATFRGNFALIGEAISPFSQLNFALIAREGLPTPPEKGQIVDNFSSPFTRNFRKDATVAELICGIFRFIPFFLKTYAVLAKGSKTPQKTPSRHVIFQNPAVKRGFCR